MNTEEKLLTQEEKDRCAEILRALADIISKSDVKKCRLSLDNEIEEEEWNPTCNAWREFQLTGWKHLRVEMDYNPGVQPTE